MRLVNAYPTAPKWSTSDGLEVLDEHGTWDSSFESSAEPRLRDIGAVPEVQLINSDPVRGLRTRQQNRWRGLVGFLVGRPGLDPGTLGLKVGLESSSAIG